MRRILAVLLVVIGGAVALAQDAPGITPAEFQQLHSMLRQIEKWQAIPWKASILEARAAAQKEGKPLFIWAMDGQTLACV